MHCQSAIVFKLDAFKMNIHIKKRMKENLLLKLKKVPKKYFIMI